ANASPSGRSHEEMSGANASPSGRSHEEMSGANASPPGRSHQQMSGANASPIGRSHQQTPGANSVLEVKDLKTHFFTDEGVVKAVDGVSFSVPKGQTLGLVGESGSGKSVTAMSITRLISPPGRIVGGEVLLNGRNLIPLSDQEMRFVRGAQVAMIFQE